MQETSRNPTKNKANLHHLFYNACQTLLEPSDIPPVFVFSIFSFFENILENPDDEQISKSQPQQLSQTPHHFFSYAQFFSKLALFFLLNSEIF